ncbi:unnamed protein product, partial [Rotaria magnacalcarata]
DFYLVISFEIEFYACDLTLVNRDLALIVIEDNNINNVAFKPSLTILV